MLSTQRFSSRVEDYRKYRPGYPAEIAADLTAEGALAPGAVVVDVGSGTGLLTRLFLEKGHAVFGVEPNTGMRTTGEEELKGFPRFTSMDGSAEATGLAPAGVDLIVAGQAFHWFDQEKAKIEFKRILRPGGMCALIWNERKVQATPFLVAYEEILLRYATDYSAVDHRRITPEVIAAFFHPHAVARRVYPHQQIFNFEGVKGRLLSSSFAPPVGDPRHGPMLAALQAAFDAHQEKGAVAFLYDTLMYTGQLHG